MSNGVASGTRREVCRMRPPIHITGSETMASSSFENIKTLLLAIVDELRAICRRNLTGASRRLASHVRFVSDLHSIIKQRSRPRLKRNLAELGLCCHEGIGGFARIGCEETEI